MTFINNTEVCFCVHHQVMIHMGSLESMKEEKELFKAQWRICLCIMGTGELNAEGNPAME